MAKLLHIVVILVVVVALLATEADAWGRRRRRRRRVNCGFNNWSRWSTCNAACNRGTQYRRRYIYRWPCCGGWGCPSTYTWRYCGTYNGGCQQRCSGNGYCSCYTGYYKSGSRCYDINECARGYCNQGCTNTAGSYRCSCYYGYYLATQRQCNRVSCGTPRLPSCPSSSYRDQFGTACNNVYVPSCNKVYQSYCYPRCSSSYYKLATYSGGGAFLSDYSRTKFESISRVQCQGNKVWTDASLLSRLYCRRINDPPTSITLSTTALNEGTAVGTTIATFSTSDPQTSQAHVYTMRTGTANTGYYLFQVSGNKLINRWVPALGVQGGITHTSFQVTVRATDNGTPNMYREQAFTIRIINKNDPPENLQLTPWQIKEDVGVGTRVGTLTAYDRDIPGTTNPCAAWILRDSDNGFFRLSGNTIYTAKSLNHEAQSFHSIAVICQDKGSVVYSTTATLVVDVQDAKDPPISITINKKNVDENVKAGALVGTVTALDEDDESLQITMFPTSSIFQLSPTSCTDITSTTHVHRKSCSAKLTVKASGSLNWELTSWYLLNLYARDSTPSHLHKVLTVNVTVNNLNEQPTSITIPTRIIQENSPGGSQVSDLNVADPDNQVQLVQRPTCVLAPGGDNSKFQIEGQSPNYDLALATGTVVDYEVKKQYSITITCNDHGLPDMSITRSFVIMVQDENEAPTGVTLTATSLKENVPVGATVGTFSTSDPDSTAQTFKYTLLPTGGADLPFKVMGSKLVTNASIDFETEEAYIISVATEDQGGLEFIGQVDLNITDVPEAPTSVTLDGAHSFPENSAAGTLIGNIIVVDQDFNQLPTCAVEKDESGGALTVGGTGGDELIAGSTMVDFETQGSTPLKVQIKCTDSNGLSKSATFSITVTNVNEAPTNITLDKNTVPEHTAPYIVGQLTVEDPDVGEPHNCSVQDNTDAAAASQVPESQFFKINKNNQLEVIKQLDYDGGLDTYLVHVLCSDIPTNPNQTSFVIERDIPVYVINVNEPPSSPCVGAQWSVSEAAAKGAVVTTPLQANDTDPDQNLTYILVNAGSVPFYINMTNDIIMTNGGLDYETTKFYDLRIKVTDDGSLDQVSGVTTSAAPASATFTCRVNILDANDPHAIMDVMIIPPNVCVDEHVTAGTTVATLSTVDKDAGATFTYKMSPTGGPLEIMGNKIVATNSAETDLDTEAGVTNVVITITSTDNHGLSVSRPFTICIKPVNENATKMCLVGDSIKENTPGQSTIGQIVVQDPDQPLRTCGPPPQPHTELPNNYSCAVNDDTTHQTYTKLFTVNTGLQLKQRAPLNYEGSTPIYHVPVICTDKHAPFNQISAIFTIKVIDVNEAPVNIQPDVSGQNMPYNATSTVITIAVPERQSGVTLLTLTAMDPDHPRSAPLLTYTASGDGIPSMMEMQNNQLVLLKALDYETKKQYVLNVRVTDDGKPPPSLTTSIKVIVNVVDSHDLPTRINLVCKNGALFPFANSTERPKPSSTLSKPALNITAPTWPSKVIPHPGIPASHNDCSRLMAGNFSAGSVVGEVYPEDQDAQKWYTFSLLGKSARYFAIYPYGTMYMQKYTHSALLLIDPSVNVFNFTYGNPTYDIYVDVYDNYGMQQTGHIVHIKTFDACYSKRSDCITPSTCMPSKTNLGQVTCGCAKGSFGDGKLPSKTGCKSCKPGETADASGNCKQVHECKSNPCVNGHCVDGVFAYTCSCPTGYTGTHCETNLEGCAQNMDICQNGGTCVDTANGGSLTCNCATGFSGRHCEYYQAACNDFPASCQTGAKFCALTPHVGQLESTPLCVHNIDMVHLIVEGVPSGADTTTNQFYYAVGGYLDEILANANFGHNFSTYALNQLGASGSKSRTRRSTTFTKLSSKPFLTQVLNVTALQGDKVLASATVLVAASSYKMASAASICPKLDSFKDTRCAHANDCALIESVHFVCSPLPLTELPASEGSATIAYVQTYDPVNPSANKPPCNAVRDCKEMPATAGQGAGPAETTKTPFYKTTPGIVLMAVGAIVLIALLVVVVWFSRRKENIKHRYEDRRLMDEDTISTASGASSGLQIQQHGAGRFTGVKNPLFEGAPSEPTQTVTNDVYDSAEPTSQVVENSMYDASDTAALYEELPQ